MFETSRYDVSNVSAISLLWLLYTYPRFYSILLANMLLYALIFEFIYYLRTQVVEVVEVVWYVFD